MRNIANYQYGINHTLNGINLFNNNSTINTFQDAYNQLILKNALADTIVTAFKSSTISKLTSISYLTTTTAKVNLGFEYSLLNDKLSLGILSYSQIFNNIVNEEITGSVNSRPLKWLNASVSYSLFNGRMSNIGAGLGLKTGVFHWFLAADYVPIEIKTVPFYLGNNHPNVSIPIPYNSTTFNLSLGMNIVFDKSMNEKRGLVRPNKRQDCNCDWK